MWRVVVFDLETSKEKAKTPLKCFEFKPTMGCDAERERERERKREKVLSSYLHLCLQSHLSLIGFPTLIFIIFSYDPNYSTHHPCHSP